MSPPAKPRRPRKSIFATLSGVVFPVWSIRLLGALAVGIAIGAPFLAKNFEWVLDSLFKSPVNLPAARAAILPQMVRVPRGTFWLRTEPKLPVTVSGFEICESEVTVQQFKLVADHQNVSCNYGCYDDYPIKNLGWEDAVGYLNRLTELENQARPERQMTKCYDDVSLEYNPDCTGYRLPTDEEWQYAALSGSTSLYSFGAQKERICHYGNINDISVSCNDDYESIAPVMQFKPNDWGLHDMYGNVWEWVSLNSEQPETMSYTLRGASFRDDAKVAPTTYPKRLPYGPAVKGFRCARSVPSKNK